MSILKRLSADATNAYQDVYSSWIGDDAGKSATFTLVLRQSNDAKSKLQRNPHRNRQQSTSPIGMTFLEVNGRAYVYSVTRGSAADEAGIMPQDSVQYAAIVRPERIGRTEQHNTSIDQSSGRNAEQYVLDLEKRGARIAYEQLHHLLLNKACLEDAFVHAAFLSPLRASEELDPSNPNTWNGPPIPSNVCIPIRSDHFHPDEDEATVTDNSLRRSNTDEGDNNGQQPVVFVFRRTRQRKSFLHVGLLPAFRLDDECDLASSLVRRLAPSADMDIPPPDTWEELVQDGTDWLLGQGSILPPAIRSDENQNPQLQRRRRRQSKKNIDDSDFSSPPDVSRISLSSSENNDDDNNDDNEEDDFGRIPLDEFEKDRTFKLASLRSRMAVEAMKFNRSDDVEAATIRGMIQKAVGLAFVRASKIVLGVSVHGGSGIVIARLSDGTWSAPSAIGTWGLGLGLQFGLEVAEYIFILQTHDALEHFRKGNSFTLGGNMGLAFGGLGREAYGAASVGSSVCGSIANVNDEDQYNGNDSRIVPPRESRSHIAPIVAYAKSQGFYVGVSLEGSRIFTRDDINSRVYKFATSGRNVTACDILSGKVPTPPEAEELYASLHSVEFAHEMSCLPRPPEILRRDVANTWLFDRCSLAPDHETNNGNGHAKQRPAFSFLSSLTTEEKDQCDAFEARFKNFMYGGVSVQRLLIDDPECDSSSIGATNTGRGRNGRKPKTGKERRTLWLMLPEVGSLRLGFVSKLSDGENHVSNISSTRQARRDDRSRVSAAEITTVGSEELTLDSALQTKDESVAGPMRIGNVQLSETHSVALTDITSLSQQPTVHVCLRGDDKMQHHVISIQDLGGANLLFLANNYREAELLICGLKLLLERETTRLGVRGGLPLTALGGRSREGVMSPAAARGFREIPSKSLNNASGGWHSNSGSFQRQNQNLTSTNSVTGDETSSSELDATESDLPEGRKKWGTVPGRNFMRGQAEPVLVDSTSPSKAEPRQIQYIHGQLIRRAIAKHVHLMLPFHFCRILLLDSSSPVMQKWERDRGDKDFERTKWAFPISVAKESGQYTSEHQLVASNNMCGAYRTTSFDRPRYGSMIRFSEVHTVEIDDPQKVTLSVFEQNPRRGFSITVRISIKARKDETSEITVYGDIRPIGKDMSNQTAVHKAYTLVLDEIRMRFGLEDDGFLAVFHSALNKMSNEGTREKSKSIPRAFRRTDPTMHDTNQQMKNESEPNLSRSAAKPKSGLVSLEDILKTGRESPETTPNIRPCTPSIFEAVPQPNPAIRIANKVASRNQEGSQEMMQATNQAVLVEVRPLPKIRLSLMPAPREEDEYSSNSKPIKKKKPSSKSPHRSSSTRSRSRSRSQHYECREV